MHQEIKRKIINILLEEKKKEYLCHIKFVVNIALYISQEYKNVDKDIIEIACLLHDIGRDKELGNEKHNYAGKRLAETILSDSNLNDDQKKIIYDCILSHNSPEIPKSIEEQIVRSADGGSKVEYHEAFMLMCEKETYEERLVWGSKYLNTGFASISIESYKNKIEEKYNLINESYQTITKMI
jgi:putative nucleotidyltransferase with HDIG domain